MISPSPISPATPSHPPSPSGPCPYHRPGQDCDKEKHCPLYLFGEYVTCTTLNQHQIVMVRAWVEANER